MGTNKINISVNLDDNDLSNVLKSIIKNKDIVLLMYDVFSKDTVASQWLFKMQLGAAYPEIPSKGALGYIDITKKSGWNGDWDNYKDSHFNKQGYIPVVVSDFMGLNEYYPLKVLAPEFTDEKGKTWTNEFRIDIHRFIPEDECDFL